MNKQKLIIPIISVGHGGMIAGEYQTKGKRHTYEDGTTIYEGEFNRDIKNRVCAMLHANGYPYIDLAPEQRDVSRKTKVNRSNKHRAEQKAKGNDTFLIEIHANAGGGTGCEVFIASNASKSSKILANLTQELYLQYFGHKWRGIKVKDWDIVHDTHMPANLFEFFFMDNEENKEWLTTDAGRQICARFLYDVIHSYIISKQTFLT